MSMIIWYDSMQYCPVCATIIYLRYSDYSLPYLEWFLYMISVKF